MVTIIQRWRSAKEDFISEVNASIAPEPATLKRRYDSLLELFNRAITEQEDLKKNRGCFNYGKRLFIVSSLETFVFGLGVAAIVLSNSEMGSEYPWIKIAGVASLAASQVLSKANDLLTHRANKRAACNHMHEVITSEGTIMLNLANKLFAPNLGGEASAWDNKKVVFLDAIQPMQEGLKLSLSRQGSQSSLVEVSLED